MICIGRILLANYCFWMNDFLLQLYNVPVYDTVQLYTVQLCRVNLFAAVAGAFFFTRGEPPTCVVQYAAQ